MLNLLNGQGVIIDANLIHLADKAVAGEVGVDPYERISLRAEIP
jgi:hypothetical protein